jgi:ParB family chromosome partitioning protein
MLKQQQTGLGKGLGALIPKKDFLEAFKDSLSQLDIKQIKEELVNSIKEKGVIEPIVVLRTKEGYQLICGERRLRAVKILGLKQIPAIVKENLNEQEILQLSLIENIQRQDLNVIEQAKGVKRLIKEFELSQEEAARLIAKQRSSVSHLLRLLTLPIEIQEELKKERIFFGHAKALLILEDENKQKSLCERIIRLGLSVREAEELVKNTPRSTLHAPRQTQKIKDPQIKEVEEKLEKFLGTKVDILVRKKGGKVEIAFYSLDDLERLLSLLKIV